LRTPPTNDALVRYSFEELRAILRWQEEVSGADETPPRAVLVGGWAVYAYNPYFGSYDIDLVTNSRTRRSLMHYLIAERGFEKYKNPSRDQIGVVLVTPIDRPVYIDFASIGGQDTFEGTGGRIGMDDLVSTATVQRPGGWWVPLPSRTSLLLMKLKAAWDRQWRIDHGTSRDPDWEREKVVKDMADILALVDVTEEEPPLEIGVLGTWIDDHQELGQVLDLVSTDRRAYDFYDRDPGVVKRKVDDLLTLTR
jgi:hypothetical protein